MSIILIVIYCLVAALFIFGLTFHDELFNEKARQQRVARSLKLIQGSKKARTRLHHHV